MGVIWRTVYFKSNDIFVEAMVKLRKRNDKERPMTSLKLNLVSRDSRNTRDRRKNLNFIERHFNFVESRRRLLSSAAAATTTRQKVSSRRKGGAIRQVARNAAHSVLSVGGTLPKGRRQ